MRIGNIIAGGMVLIALYLALAHGNTTVRIIQTIAENTIQGIKTFQGRG